MAMTMGFGSPTSLLQGGKNKRRVFRGTVSASLKEQYTTLRVQPGASEKEVKKPFDSSLCSIIRMFVRGAIVGFSFIGSMKPMIL
ncbi:hypothetical protein QJS10_CPB18g00369 [Acorus calamus]|uniref:Uncharacterized protein n=1 Tax=Acorus calamus TaxID=4465 RepID=A0AAV9CNH8_ACOCL|nr:hypothetical protein QJS10_CPB18g00369 [Acorus calamus]